MGLIRKIQSTVILTKPSLLLRKPIFTFNKDRQKNDEKDKQMNERAKLLSDNRVSIMATIVESVHIPLSLHTFVHELK